MDITKQNTRKRLLDIELPESFVVMALEDHRFRGAINVISNGRTGYIIQCSFKTLCRLKDEARRCTEVSCVSKRAAFFSRRKAAKAALKTIESYEVWRD